MIGRDRRSALLTATAWVAAVVAVLALPESASADGGAAAMPGTSSPRIDPSPLAAASWEGTAVEGREVVRFTDLAPRWSPDGSWVAFARPLPSTLARVDLRALSARSGAGRRVGAMEGISEGGDLFGPLGHAWSPGGGHLAYWRAGSPRGLRLAGFGGAADLYPPELTDWLPPGEFAWSWDGTRIAFARGSRSHQTASAIHVWHLGSGAETQLTSPPGGTYTGDGSARWSPAADGLAFVRSSSGAVAGGTPQTSHALWTIAADGSAPARLALHDGPIESLEWSPDGTAVAYVSWEIDEASGCCPWTYLSHVRIARVGESAYPSAFRVRGSALRWSTDGRRLAVSEPLGTRVYSFSGEPVRTLPGARDPQWSPDGRLLAFVRGVDLVVVGVGGTGARRLLAARQFSWSPDGKRIAASRAGCGQLRGIALVDVASGSASRLTAPSFCGIAAGEDHRGPIHGTPGRDFIYGGHGPEVIRAAAGPDVIAAGDGRDTIHAGAGNDVIDAYDAGERDRIHCGPGRDRVLADRIDVVSPDCERVERR